MNFRTYASQWVFEMVVMFDIETLGLDAFEHQIVLIGMRTDGKTTQWKLWEQEELDIILECLKTFEQIPFDETIVGYNNLKFDAPFIAARLQTYGKSSSRFWTLLYRDRKWFDLYQFMGNSFRRMDLWLDRFGIKRKYDDIRGRDIPELFRRKEYKKIEEHNKDDLNTSERLYLKLPKEFPQLLRV